ncbi:transcriptional regulator [Ameyamaea chiangmaiensis NBRC 103196]|uniref:GntR family transcriptional regulator n=1 Tax=Ameyamaea chiangmaiensis TaxID=442969 RepID=A0A850PCJ1_9PROT|nr:GntR family transcriptional regulator [Ameyamaea chiangmaiensis]MBS4073849.1 GntR family transcriptional regulator [Ameyamaea chiangmaiensis]NVN40623.1 GntR family transcriptional regulator [Ameyamaea chiangmaiensis]GBQ68195.1 transcriptional regulator [Ameyamaea chiangmaiensis NBRC 103196]
MRRLDQGSLSNQAYLALREELIAGGFRPGARLLMRDLAERLGTSITPVREACQRLTSEHGLELRSGRFVVVPEVTLERYRELRVIRIALEGLAAERAAANARTGDIVRLRAIQRDYEDSWNRSRDEGVARLNRAFHFGVYELSGLPILVRQIENLWLSMGPILKLFHESVGPDYGGFASHRAALEALERHDEPGARDAIVADLVTGGAEIESYIARLK